MQVLLCILVLLTTITTISCQTKPRDVDWTMAKSTSIRIQWTSVGTMQYRVKTVLVGSTDTSEPTGGFVSSPYDVEDLQPRMVYNVFVFEYYSNGSRTGNDAAQISTLYTGPSSPTNVRISSSTSAEIVIEWDDDDSGPVGGINVNKYRVTYKSDGGSDEVQETEDVADGSAPPKTIEIQSLTSNTDYIIVSVVSLTDNLKVTSDASASTTGRTNIASPTALRIGATTDDSIHITWTAHSGGDARPITGYKVSWSPNHNTGSKDVGASATSTQIDGLTSNTKYDITVVALYDGGGEGETSDAVEGITDIASPTELIAASTTVSTIDMHWTAPSGGKARTITGYKVSWTPDHNTGSKDVGASETSTKIDGLNSNTKYDITVVALYDGGGEGETSDAVEGITDIASPTALIVGSTTASTIGISWARSIEGGNARTITGYRISWSPDHNSGSKVVVGATTALTQITGLDSNTKYDITVVALYGGGGEGETSGAVEGITDIASPTALTINAMTVSTIGISWTAPVEGGNARSITGYRVSWSPNHNGGSKDVGASATSTQIDGLNSNTKYDITVVALYGGGQGETSDAVEGITEPDSIENLTVVENRLNSSSKFNLTWNTPSSGGDNITIKYTGLRSNDSKTFYVDFQTEQALFLPSPGDNYTIEVTVQSGGLSSVVVRKLISSTPFSPIYQSTSTSDQIMFSWSSLEGYYESIVIEPIHPQDAFQPVELLQGELNHTIRGLLPFTSYTVLLYSTITDVNGEMKRSASNNRTIATQAGAPELAVPQPYFPSIFSTTSAIITLPAGTFTDKNGPIENYAVYISRISTAGPRPNAGNALPCDWLFSFECVALWTYRNGTPVTNARKKYDNHANVKNNNLQFVVGSFETTVSPSSQDHINYPLNPNTVYFVSVAAKTSNQDIVATNWGVITTQEEERSLGWVAGLVVAIFAVVGVLLVIATIQRKRLQGKRTPSRQPEMSNIIREDGLGLQSQQRGVRSKIIQLPDFDQHFQYLQADSNFKFAEEYQEFSSVGKEQPTNEALKAENRGKNRYTNILPYDKTRVKLSVIDGKSDTDYVNANYIPGNNHEAKAYIATQGPLPGTKDDFWRMVWEQNCKTIVMLTQTVERGRIKCDQYWPFNEAPVILADLTLQTTAETILPEWTTREFCLSKDKERRVVRQYSYNAWPDHGVPDTAEALVRFVRNIRENINQDDNAGPVVVHCSAGVGRTGTFIAMDRLLQHLQEHSYVDIFGIVHQMRMHRVFMVQTESQYILIHKMIQDIVNTTYNTDSENTGDPIYENTSAQPEPVYANSTAAEMQYEDRGVVNLAMSDTPPEESWRGDEVDIPKNSRWN